MHAVIPITLETTANAPIRPYITARKGDNLIRVLRVSLTSGRRLLKIPTDMTAVLNCAKPDRRFTMTYGEIGGEYIDFPLGGQSLSTEGEVCCDVRILKDSEVLTSAKFSILVEEPAVTDQEVETSEEFNVLSDLIERAEKAAERAENAAAAAGGGNLKLGEYTLTPVIDGVTARLQIHLEEPVMEMLITHWRLYAHGSDVSGAVSLDDGFVTAPMIFENQELAIVLERNGKPIFTVTMQKEQEDLVCSVQEMFHGFCTTVKLVIDKLGISAANLEGDEDHAE